MSQEIVNKKNIDALHNALKHERDRVSELNKEIDNLNNRVSMFQEELATLRQQLAAMISLR